MVDAQKLANQFILVICEWLTLEEIAEVNRLNAGEEITVCHTHDFCDANMAMDTAFQTVVGHSIDADDAAQCALWNSAWDIAKKQRFTWSGDHETA